MMSVGAVLVRSALCSRLRAPAATASARYTLYEPLCVPITLRCARLVVVPTIGPRSAGVGAPHWSGSAPWPPACEVSRMWRGAEGSAAIVSRSNQKPTLAKGGPLCDFDGVDAGGLLPELPLDRRADAPVRGHLPLSHMAMQAGIRPVSGPQHPAVLDGIEVDVIDVTGEVGVVLDLVFPEAGLP